MKSNDLEKNRRDWVTAITKSVAGIIPFAGGVLGEIVGNTIPNQRFDRTIEYVKQLGARIDELETSTRLHIKTNASAVDLIERGGQSAIKALTNERIRNITEIVAKGLTKNDVQIRLQKRLLIVLDELDDIQLLTLPLHINGIPRKTLSKMQKRMGLDKTINVISSVEESTYHRVLHVVGTQNMIRVGALDGHIKRDASGNPRLLIKKGEYDSKPILSELGHLILNEIGYWDTDPDGLIKGRFVMQGNTKPKS